MDDSVQGLREDIESNDLNRLAISLKVCEEFATGTPEMIALLESLLDDRRLCRISIPIYIGEIRYLAAIALREERKKAGIKTPLEVEVVYPMNAIEIGRLAAQYGIKTLGAVDTFTELIAMNVAPMLKFTI